MGPKKMNPFEFPRAIPPQHQNIQPGFENKMNPRPIFEDTNYVGANRLVDKVAVITGGDSGIGRAVAIAYAKEGANLAIMYLNEEEDANETKTMVENYGGRCLLISGDIGNEDFCNAAIEKVISEYGEIHILVNNAAEQHPQNSIEDITSEQLIKTFNTNIFGIFYITKAALKHMKKGSSIINTASVTAYEGHKTLIDYSCTKGALVTFTRSLHLNLIDRNIRVNAVAPGPIWTPLIPSSFTEAEVSKFGSNAPMKRPGQPIEVAGAYIFLASDEASYISGQVLHINGGVMVSS
jgi:NAD(P)-dependent dehydrogenase (short-subunit alcohol dehydrogenase family)